MPFPPKSSKKILHNLIFLSLVSLVIISAIPTTRGGIESFNVTMKIGGVYQSIYEDMPLSGIAEGQMELIGSDLPNIETFQVTLDGTEVTSGSGTPGPVPFSFDTENITNGRYLLVVTAYLDNSETREKSTHVIIQNSAPTYRINVNVTDEEEVTRILTDGIAIQGRQTVFITAYKDGIPALMSSVNVFLGSEILYSAGAGTEVSFWFETVNFPDGTYEFRVNATIEGNPVSFTARVVVQNRNPVLFGIALACFGLAALALLLHIRGSKKRTVVALLRATEGPASTTPATGAMQVNPVRDAATPVPKAAPVASKSLPNPPTQGPSLIRKGWKNFVPLPALVVILAILLAWVFMTPEATFIIGFGPWFAYPLPHYALLIALGLSLVSAWKWRTTASTAIGAILYVVLVLGSIFALANTIIGGGLEALLGGGGMELTAGSFLIVVGTTMLSWLATPPPAAVLATRFARWQSHAPRYLSK